MAGRRFYYNIQLELFFEIVSRDQRRISSTNRVIMFSLARDVSAEVKVRSTLIDFTRTNRIVRKAVRLRSMSTIYSLIGNINCITSIIFCDVIFYPQVERSFYGIAKTKWTAADGIAVYKIFKSTETPDFPAVRLKRSPPPPESGSVCGG